MSISIRSFCACFALRIRSWCCSSAATARDLAPGETDFRVDVGILDAGKEDRVESLTDLSALLTADTGSLIGETGDNGVVRLLIERMYTVDAVEETD